MEIGVGVLDHYNVSTRKLKETVQFYEDVLGFVNASRREVAEQFGVSPSAASRMRRRSFLRRQTQTRPSRQSKQSL